MIEQLSPTANGRLVQAPTHDSVREAPIDVAVVGGGLAGLAAAITAARAGRSVTLYEGASALGGRARTRDDRGFHFNLGAHAMYRGGAGLGVLRDLGIEPHGGVVSTAGALAVKHGGIHRFPADPWGFLTTTALDLSSRFDLGRFLAGISSVDPARFEDVTVRDWLNAALRTDAARRVVEVLVRTALYSDALDHLSAAVAIRQTKVALGGVLYLHGGWQTLVDGLRARAESLGVRMVTGARVVAVEHDRAVRALRMADETRRSVRAVTLAVDPDEASTLLGGDQPQLAQWASAASPVRVASFDLGLRRLPQPSARLTFSFDRPLFQSVHSAWARLAPDGSALIDTTRYLDESERGGPDVEREIEDLLDLTQPGWRDEVVVRRFVPSLTVSNALPTVAWQTAGPSGPAVDGINGLFVAGDWVGREGLLADRALLSGRRAGVEAAGATATLAGQR